MTIVRVSNPLDRDFGMVPRGLWSLPWSFTAKGLAAYLLCLRDGSEVPYVAQIEAQLRIGRDLRRKGFAELEAAGFIEWSIERNAARQIVAKTLVLRIEAILSASNRPVSHAPEIQAGGSDGEISSHAPENPSGGFSTPAEAEVRLCGDGISGDLLRERKGKKERAAARARSFVGKKSAALAGAPLAAVTTRAVSAAVLVPVSELKGFEKSLLLAGRDLVLAGRLLKAGSPDHEALRLALRREDA